MLIDILHGSDGPVAAAAQLPALPSFTNTGQAGFICYSGIKFDADGGIYRRNTLSTYSRVGTWMLTGANTDYSVNVVALSGTLDNGTQSTDLQLNVDREFWEENSTTDSTETCTIQCIISNWNGGAPDTVYATRNYTFTAIVESP